jgi:hypothetical protein
MYIWNKLKQLYMGKCGKYRINDAHCHYGTNSIFMTMALRPTTRISNNIKRLQENMDRNNVENCVLFAQPEPSNTFGHFWKDLFYHLKNKSRGPDEPYSGWKIDYTRANDEIWAIDEDRVAFIPFIAANDSDKNIAKYEDENENPPAGIKYYGIYGNMPDDSILSYMNENCINLLLHIPMACSKNPCRLLDKVEQYPDINFQLAHLRDGVPEIIKAVDDFDNLYLDTAMSNHEAYRHMHKIHGTTTENIITSQSEGKVLFGSDEPWGDLQEQLQDIAKLQEDGSFSEKDVDRVLYQKAAHLWNF